MNSRERVLFAINHKEPDRVPIFRSNMIPTYDLALDYGRYN